MKTNGRSTVVVSAAEAAEWRLIALLLERPRPGWRDEIGILAQEIEDGELRVVAAAADADEGEYLRLVGPGGRVSPREVTYRPQEDPGWILADLAHTYEAFAFHPRAEDPLDHIAVETSFVGYLFLKEAFARARGDGEAAGTTASARRSFLENHLAVLAQGFARRLEAYPPSHLPAVARLLAARAPRPAISGRSRYVRMPGGASQT